MIQFKVRSTNKSPYNAAYLVHWDDSGALDELTPCDPIDNDNLRDSLVDYLPYAPHQERHNNRDWPNSWRTFHAVVPIQAAEGQALVVCSRDKNGNMVGDLDNFYIKDVVIHYQVIN